MAVPTRTAIGVAVVVGFGAGSAAAYWYVSGRAAPPPPPPPPPVTTRATERTAAAALAAHPALKYGMPLSDSLRVLTNVVLDFDTRLRVPRWVLEHFSAESLRGDGDRTNSYFYEDASIDRRFRSKLSDYKNSGYDRGHMAPASNHRYSQQAMDETFTLSNAAPQVGDGFNRDMWSRLERFVQETATTCANVWVVTGPLFLPLRRPDGAGYVMQHATIGEPPQMVAVPTHFYKVVLGEVRPGAGGRKLDAQLAVGAFVMPNTQIDPATPLSAFVVPLSALEEVAGTRFFPGYLSEGRRLALDEAALAEQRRGQAELQQLKLTQHLVPLLPSTGQALPPAVRATQLPAPVTGPGGGGAVHLCEHRACRLPPPNWWAKGKGDRKQLRRTKSSPAL